MPDKNRVLSREYLVETIRSLLLKYHAQTGILFGSYAREEAGRLSDIDLMVIGGDAFEPTDVFCLADDLHRITGKEVDVYEVCEIDPDSGFYQTILKEGVRIAA